MSTSLAEQLQRLAVPQTTLLTRDKKRPSLLFDPKEAANLNKDTIYQIGIDGLEELKSRNPIFIQFENTLFHITAKDLERAVESAESNQRLNKNIRKFLILLSPYFLFNCSYKALEWLVYRYYIHEYNKEDLLMLILPYHETNIFVRALQLLNLKEPNDKWNWLKPLQRPGIHLPKQTLYNHAASDVYFLEFVSNLVLSIIKEHEKPSSLTVIFNFYCTTFIGALEYSQEVNEAQISQMLPVILKGLTSDIPDFSAATYVVTAKLLTQSQLSEKILEKFVEKVTQMNVTNLTSEAVLVLIVLYQSQKHFDTFPDVAVKNLYHKDGFAKNLEKLNTDGIHIYPLLGPILHSGVSLILSQDDNVAYMKFIDAIIAEVKIDDAFIYTLLNSILDIYYRKHKYPEKNVTWLKEFVSKVERQHPISFDVAVKKIMTTTNDPNQIQHQKALRKLIQNVTNSHDSYELFEKLYHPNSELRIEGLKMLLKKFNIFKEKEVEMLQNALFDRLNDDSLEVVSETLHLFKSKFPEVVNMNNFKEVLIKLLIKCQSKNEWWKVTGAALSVLCRYFNDSDVQVFLATLPFLLPTADFGLKAAKQIVTSDYGKKSKMLRPLQNELINARDYNEFSAIMYKNLKAGVNLPDATVLVQGLKREDSSVLEKYVAMLVLSSSLPKNCDVEVSNLVLDIFESYLSTSKMIVVKHEAKVADYIILAKRNKFSLQSYLHCVEGLILKSKVPEGIGLMNLGTSKFYLRLLKMLVKGSRSSKFKKSSVFCNCLKKFWVFCKNDLKSIVEVLLNVAICDDDLVDEDFRLGCLQIVRDLLKNEQKRLSLLCGFGDVVVPYVLVGLTLTNEGVRKILLNTIEILVKFVKPTDDNYVKLLIKLKKYREEIGLDNEQMPVIIRNVIPLDNVSGDKYLKMCLNVLVKSINNEKYPVYLKSGLITVISQLNDLSIYTETSKIAINILENNNKELNGSESEIVQKNIVRFDPSIAEVLVKTSPIWEFIKLSIEKDTIVLKNKTKSSPSSLILNQIERELFSKLKPHIQGALLDLIITVATTSQNPEVLQSANHVFKRIDLDSKLVLEQLTKMRDVQSPKLDVTKRKRRVTIIPTIDILDTIEWKKGVTILEFMQDKKKIRNTNQLLSILFEILKKCLDFDEQSSVEYPKQLLLSTILHCCDKIEDEPLPENTFNMQLVVQCIRASQNPQTHHHALLLLAKTASLIPKQVLHHIIAIFTFVGSSVLRHDDAYSFQIITKIIDTIIPILIKDGQTKSIETVLRVFVDAILDVPEHRRMPLFKQLLTSLNPEQNLHLFLLIVFEAHVVHGHLEKQKINKNRSLAEIDEVPKRLDIAADLSREFSPEIVFVSCIKMLEHLRKLPEEKTNYVEGDDLIFDIKRYTPKQFRHYKYTIVTFIGNLLTSSQFIEKLATFSDEEMLEFESLFKDMIINVLNYIQETSKVAERNSNTPQAQYWKVVLHYSYDILDAINALLTSKMFLLVIRGLMVYSLSAVRKRALELLNNKLQSNSTFLNECDRNELYNVIVSSLINIIKALERPDIEPEQELIVQKALISLKLLVKHLAPEEPTKFVQILDFIADLVKSSMGKVNENTLASLVLCLSELCCTLRAHAISSLNKFMPVLIKILKSQKRLETPNLLLISNITALHKILDSLPLFLSPYLEKILYEVSSLACKWNIEDDQKLTPFITKLQSIQQKMGAVIPLRVLLPAIENSYTNLVNKSNFPAIAPLMAILSECLSHLKGPEIQTNINDLTAFFLNALQFRANGQSTHEQAVEVENHVIKAFVTLILKLSESSFRPLYYKLFDWAVRTDAKTERVITFYNLSYAFANCLKGLFVLFAGHFLNNAATLLDACNNVKNSELYFEENNKNVALVENILRTLHAIFLYDSHKFVTKERFEVLMQPVVDQLENTLGGLKSLENRANKILTPCLVQFAVATADDALWKQMNYQILLKMRHNSPNIRLVALECLSETAKKLGEDFLPLLPETIPFLAELLEDEEESVEKACQKTVQELEKVLGEPLQKYF